MADPGRRGRSAHRSPHRRPAPQPVALVKRAGAIASQLLADVVLTIALVPLGLALVILTARERLRK